jgi:peptidoglycan/LPS O-acetylase OafA/YrhL
MNSKLSVYLDIIRFTSALLVFLSHVPSFIGGHLWQLGGFGHEAVVVFFVLSGFVIAFVCVEKKESFFDYAVNRIVRIYSVALPALLLTFGSYFFIEIYNPDSLNDMRDSFSSLFTTLFTGLTFTNQSWVDTRILTNTPYWSMGYEVLYYFFFAAMFYFSGWRRWLSVFAILLVMGPSILLYLPVWLAGVFCFWVKDRVALNVWVAFTGYIASLLAFFYGCSDSWQTSINSLWQENDRLMLGSYILDTAKYFLSDYYLAIVVVLNIFFANSVFVSARFNLVTRVEAIVKMLSAHTFSLYLLHMPLLFLLNAVLPFEKFGVVTVVAVLFAIPLVIFLISSRIESGRYTARNWLAKFFRLHMLRVAVLESQRKR